MTPADIPQAQALTASFGWPHRREDWALMQALGKGLVAEQNGRLLGTALCWRFGRDWATLGMIGVRAEAQGRGIGRRMLQALVEGLADRSLALHATEAGMSLYSGFGFVPTGQVAQHQGIALRHELVPLPRETQLRPISPPDFPAIVALDRIANGMDRSQLLARLLGESGGVVLHRGSAIAGFALVRAFGRGKLIGPVVAPDGENARAMIAAVLDRHVGQFVRIDVPAEDGFCAWLDAAGLTSAGNVVRMVRGPDVPTESGVQVFALGSQAFG
jgi:predicted N-acetyltransferase YhbS